MSTENLGVTSNEVGATSTPAAPATTDINNTSIPESTSEANASVSTPPSEVKGDTKLESSKTTTNTATNTTESAGLKNLRLHAEGLKKDLERYKPVFEQVENLGGLEAITPLVEFHNTFVSQTPEEYKESGVFNTLTTLYEANPLNFGVLIEALVDHYSEGIKQQLAAKDPEYQELLKLKGDNSEDDYFIPDDELDDELPTHKELKELRRFKAETEAAKAKQKQQTQEQTQQTQEAQQLERVNGLKSTLMGDAIEALKTAEKTVSPELFNRILGEFQKQLDSHTELGQLYEKLERQAMNNIRFALGDTKNGKNLVNSILEQVINSVSSQAKTNSAQDKTSSRIEMPTKSTSVVQKKNIPSADDPNFVNIVAEDWARRFGWPT